MHFIKFLSEANVTIIRYKKYENLKSKDKNILNIKGTKF